MKANVAISSIGFYDDEFGRRFKGLQALLILVLRHSGSPLTYSEIQSELQRWGIFKEHSTITGPIHSLKRKGIVSEFPLRACGVTGRLKKTWGFVRWLEGGDQGPFASPSENTSETL